MPSACFARYLLRLPRVMRSRVDLSIYNAVTTMLSNNSMSLNVNLRVNKNWWNGIVTRWKMHVTMSGNGIHENTKVRRRTHVHGRSAKRHIASAGVALLSDTSVQTD